MTPAEFPQANAVFGSPKDLEGSCREVRAYTCQVVGGIFDGSIMAVTAWKPSPKELRDLIEGGSVFLSVIGSLPPHYIGTRFEEVVG